MSDPFDLVFGQDNATLARQLAELRRLVLAIVRAQQWEEWAHDVLAGQNDGLPSGHDTALAAELAAALEAVKAQPGGGA